MPPLLTASNLPAGASFDQASGSFRWIPGAAQTGKYDVLFSAASAGGESSSQPVTIEVGSGQPEIDKLEHACSPGAIASIQGTWLSEGSGETRITVNASDVPVLAASADHVQFLCPLSLPGTWLDIVAETASGNTPPVHTVMQDASPWIFSAELPQQRQGIVSFAGSADLAMPRNSQTAGHPAQPGDELLILGTGFGSATETWVRFGELSVDVLSIDADTARAGMYRIRVRVPDSVPLGDAVPVQAGLTAPDGTTLTSNSVTIAIEPVHR